ncbi:hypothetical protein ACSSS7_000741 [Eimeria intestinalis]
MPLQALSQRTLVSVFFVFIRRRESVEEISERLQQTSLLRSLGAAAEGALDLCLGRKRGGRGTAGLPLEVQRRGQRILLCHAVCPTCKPTKKEYIRTVSACSSSSTSTSSSSSGIKSVLQFRLIGLQPLLLQQQQQLEQQQQPLQQQWRSKVQQLQRKTEAGAAEKLATTRADAAAKPAATTATAIQVGAAAAKASATAAQSSNSSSSSNKSSSSSKSSSSRRVPETSATSFPFKRRLNA